MNVLWTALVLCLCGLAVRSQDLPCAACPSSIKCTVPVNCELDKIPCGCCQICSLKQGEVCEAFTAGCTTGLDCLTPAGFFDRRPPWYKPYLKGVCIKAMRPEYSVTPPLPPIKSTKKSTHSMLIAHTASTVASQSSMTASIITTTMKTLGNDTHIISNTTKAVPAALVG